MKKTIYVTGRDGKEKTMTTDGGQIQSGCEKCPREFEPEYDCIKCKRFS